MLQNIIKCDRAEAKKLMEQAEANGMAHNRGPRSVLQGQIGAVQKANGTKILVFLPYNAGSDGYASKEANKHNALELGRAFIEELMAKNGSTRKAKQNMLQFFHGRQLKIWKFFSSNASPQKNQKVILPKHKAENKAEKPQQSKKRERELDQSAVGQALEHLAMQQLMELSGRSESVEMPQVHELSPKEPEEERKLKFYKQLAEIANGLVEAQQVAIKSSKRAAEAENKLYAELKNWVP